MNDDNQQLLRFDSFEHHVFRWEIEGDKTHDQDQAENVLKEVSLTAPHFNKCVCACLFA